MSTINTATRPALLFTHLPRPPVETTPGCFNYSQGWQPSGDYQYAFYISSVNNRTSHVYVKLEAVQRAELTFHLPIDLLLPLARALVDAHNHLSMPPTADSTE